MRAVAVFQAQAAAALAAARASLAQELLLAEIYAENPAYAYMQALITNASALSATDKIIFTQEGTSPTIVVPGPGIVPTVDLAGASQIITPEVVEPVAP